MANILYGVNGEGSDYSARSREVIAHLLSRGHKVQVASFDRGLRNLRDEFEVTEISGLRLAYVQNRVRYGRTVLRNIVGIPQVARSVRRWSGRQRTGISTWSSRISSRSPATWDTNSGFPSSPSIISMLTDAEISYPKEYRREASAAKMVTGLMTPKANAYLAFVFFGSGQERSAHFSSHRSCGERYCKHGPPKKISCSSTSPPRPENWLTC
jgi:hypothetical protein